MDFVDISCLRCRWSHGSSLGIEVCLLVPGRNVDWVKLGCVGWWMVGLGIGLLQQAVVNLFDSTRCVAICCRAEFRQVAKDNQV